MACPRVSAKVQEGQLVTSIYLDSESGDSYNRRLNRFEGAQLIRCRWYGDNDGDAYKEIFVERKTHHESWTGAKSTKERFALPQKRVSKYVLGKQRAHQIFDFLKGNLDIPRWAESLQDRKASANILRLGPEIENSISVNRMQPMVRTSYLRSAFQSNDCKTT